MKSQTLIKYAFASALAFASSPSFALTFQFSFTNTIGNTTGTVTGEVFGLTDNATRAASDVRITSYPSVMTGLPPAPFSLMTGSKYISSSMNSFPVYNKQVQTDGNLGHGLFEFDSMAMYDYSWDFCISGIGFATAPCMPSSWLSSENSNWTNIRHVMTDDIAIFTLIPDPVPSSELGGDPITDGPRFPRLGTPVPGALPLFATGLGGLGLLGWRRRRKAQAVA